jgi:hypothetical protein
MRHPSHYDPNQPRVPRGHSDGGQWTDGGHGQSAHVQTAFKRGPLSPLFELGPRIWALQARRAAEKELEAGLALFTTLSLQNSQERRAIIEFRAREYRRGEAPLLELIGVRILTRDQVRQVCNELKTVQDLTDDAATKVQAAGTPMNAAQYGTAVHKFVEEEVNGKPNRDPNFTAEESLEKAAEEAKETGDRQLQEQVEMRKRNPRGAPGSIRIDVHERRPDIHTSCVYDIKTGRRGLSIRRMNEIAQRVAETHGAGVRIIVIEVRPTVPRVLR